MAKDKRLDQVSTLKDFDYALIVKGDQVAKASKQQLAELVGNLLYGATNASSLATVVAELANVNFGYNSLVDLAGGVASQLSFIGTSNIDSDGKDITINGVYRIHDGGLVHPNSVSGDMLLHLGWDSNTAHQTLYSASPNIGTLVRHKSGGVWSDWGDK